MTEQKEIQCEYCTVRSNENKCKALEIEFHNCLNILEQKKCPIYKLKQQLQENKQECKNLEEELRGCKIGIKNISIENTEICKISEKYKQALDEIEGYCKEILADIFHYSQGTVITAEKINNIIKKVKNGK